MDTSAITAPVELHFSPDEDLKAIFLDYIGGTQEHLRIADYGFHMPELVEKLESLHDGGKDLALVLDSVQERGKYERPEVIELVQKKIAVAIGTSFKHEIMHDKFAIRDKRWVLAGSWNFSESATKESNFFFIIDSPELASRFLNNWQEMWDWIQSHEQKYQEKVN